MSSAGFPTIHYAGDITKKPGTGLGPRTIEDYELLYFTSGTKGVYVAEGETVPLDVPCFLVCRPGERHEYVYDRDVASRHLFIHFGFEDAPEAKPALPYLEVGGICRIPSDNELLIGMMKQLIYLSYALPERMSERAGSMLLALLLELNGELAQPMPPEGEAMPQQIVRAIQVMEDHLHEPLKVEAIARRVGWSHEHFSRSFALHTGRTPREMLLQLRIERACQLLMDEGRSIKQVAFEVGFADENYFSRMFKEVKGTTATAYRKRYANPLYRDLAPIHAVDSRYPINRVFLVNGGTKS
ncbi:helix-turn-helix transcriptional regulator [Paenibacillus antri]|uniref:Helix-turn-helix transcriptional regulator n=1 Tax=Paenibacillus antri TaxID=2582848 RepID=A0A5R9GBF9_9BACL|nr:AraC family transcriptional regulator [Paenibacillus antri]TLS53802.1 helix-turn-helix transcriptional regulator [Paenibacillus antri]